jgi:hypothetical protein
MGQSDIALGSLGNIYKFYSNRSSGNTSCFNNVNNQQPSL